ncbi:MAG: RDD family protein [Chloroflexi bacterium]|nr:RDD family protein [Chloroflexota bacterium]
MYEKTKMGGAQAGEAIELASISSRFVALFIDGIIQGIVAVLALVLIGLVWGDSAEFLMQFLALALPIGYNWYFWTRRDGQTPGKSALGIRVVKVDGSPISDVDAVIRAIGYHISSLICALGYIWAIFDKNNQSWHDKLASTYVVRKDGERHTVQM